MSFAAAKEPPSYLPTLQDYKDGLNVDAGLQSIEHEPTGSDAADSLPHEDLERSQILELIGETFEAQLHAPAAFFADLDVERYLSDHVAVVGTGEDSVLLDSDLALRAPGALGAKEAVDLSLVSVEGSLQPENPLTEVTIPAELGDGIELSDSNVRIGLDGAPEGRVPSVVDQGVAIYPNVSPNTDFAVAPTPAGVETLTQIRSEDAPLSQTLNLTLPQGASLRGAAGGGAEVVSGDETPLIKVAPPTAIDATGAAVPVSFEISGDQLTYTASPGQDVEFPILIDPILEEYMWGNGNLTRIGDWRVEGNTPYPFASATSANCGNWCQGYLAPGSYGLWIMAQATWPTAPNYQRTFAYYVPRWDADWKEGFSPTSYIASAAYFALSFQHRTDSNASPYMVGGLWWPEGNQFSVSFWRGGNQPNVTLDSQPAQLFGDYHSKLAMFGLVSSDYHALTANRDAWMGWSVIELNDPDHPRPESAQAPAQWVNNSPSVPLPFKFVDSGLGVRKITASDQKGHSWVTTFNCTGISSEPCPRAWSSSSATQPPLTYDPSVLPQGDNILELVAADPVGHASNVGIGEEPPLSDTVLVRVDHTAPTLSLAGTMTEQASLGVSRPQYTLSYTAKDGASGSPQSGVTAVEVKVDGKKVDGAVPGCSSQNCQVSREWSLSSASYALGKHTVQVIATDGVGLQDTKTLNIELQPDTASPSLSVSGKLKTGVGGWLSQPGTYSATAIATDSGAGAIKLSFSVDGTKVSEATQTCTAGGCAFNKTFSLNAANYGVGAHQLTITANDGANNAKQVTWQLNLYAQGTVSPQAVAAMDNALIAGSGVGSGASKIGGFPYDPSLETVESQTNLSVTGTGVDGDISLEATAGASVTGLSGLPIVMDPFAGIASGGATATVAGGDAIAYANVGTNKDLLVRPTRNGLTNFLTYRSSGAVSETMWEIVGTDPLKLESRADGGVNVVITPTTEVPDFTAEDPGELSQEPQVVASIAAPNVVDGAGVAVPSSLTIKGSLLVLTISPPTGATFPIAAELSLHLTGPLQSWFPSVENPTLPSEEEASGLGVTAAGDEIPVANYWKTVEGGAAINGSMPDEAGQLHTSKVPFTPPPGTVSEGVIVQAPNGSYEPAPSAVASCFGPFCAGVVNCASSPPKAPLSGAGLVIQTYGSITCNLAGDLPPGFEGVTGGACLMLRISLQGHAAWTYSKCKEAASSNPDWHTTVVVTKKCSESEVYRGRAWGGPIFKGRAVIASSDSKEGTRC